MRYLLKFITVGIFALFQGSSSLANEGGLAKAPIVKTSSGLIEGLVKTYYPAASDHLSGSNVKPSVYEYRGIPYALPPTGERRWALPIPVEIKNSDVFKAYEFGPACPQQARFNLTEESITEDCLSINVTVPAGTLSGDNLPVFVWFHGGAFVGGSSNLYQLDQLASQGKMVVVSFNYRLGALGFMPNPAFQVTTSFGTFNGNYGLEDQRLALRWVQNNITAFGGDRNNVTVAGESAGAGSICMHLLAPLQVSGLFTKAIIQSAGCMANLPTVNQANEGVSEYIQKNLNCYSEVYQSHEEVLSCMRNKTVSEILYLQGKYSSDYPSDLTPFSPATGDPLEKIINTTVPSSFKFALANKSIVDVPLLVGGTKDELGLYVGYYWQAAELGYGPPINSATMRSWLKKFYPGSSVLETNFSFVDRIISNRNYSDGLNSSNPVVVAKTFGQILSDYSPLGIVNNCLFLQTSNAIANYAKRYSLHIPIYQFEFDDSDAPVCGVGIPEPCPPYLLGSVHSSMLNYLFPNFSNTSAINAPDLTPGSQRLAKQIIEYFSNFARTGNPNSASSPKWPMYAGKQTASVMLLKPGSIINIDSDSMHQCTAFWAKPDMYDLRNAPPF